MTRCRPHAHRRVDISAWSTVAKWIDSGVVSSLCGQTLSLDLSCVDIDSATLYQPGGQQAVQLAAYLVPAMQSKLSMPRLALHCCSMHTTASALVA